MPSAEYDGLRVVGEVRLTTGGRDEMKSDRIEVKRQPGSRQWGIYWGGQLVEGGFFRYEAAEDIARDYIRQRNLMGRTQEVR
jgi:hypothetical protein